MQTSNPAKGVTDGLRSANNTLLQASAKPPKYEPPSPRNKLPQGQFNKKNPKIAAATVKLAMARLKSPTEWAIVAIVTNAITIIELANPFKPSIILIALAMPPIAIAVNKTEKPWCLNKGSIRGTPTWLNEIPVMAHPATPARIVASSRVKTLTCLVRSSANPNVNAVRPARINGPRMSARALFSEK